ncbi:MAG: AAA family ATPase [Clostridiales bacterium]|nr:ATP-binding protein [Bacillota bacterium]MEE0516295.1 ATP-binding protein [Anaerovoracaceae bacterium]PWL94660.1 MAG: AAA family ATPase [Clostridiales bacterium]
MYKSLENLIIFSEGEGRAILDEIALICRLSEKGEDIKERAFQAVRNILKTASKYGFSGNLWKNTVALYIAYNENPFSLSAERNDHVHENIFARRDCNTLKDIFNFDLCKLDKVLNTDCFGLLKEYESEVPVSDAGKVISKLCSQLSSSESFYEDISQFYMENGVGVLGLNKAFSVDTEHDEPYFVPVRTLSEIKLSDLIGYQVQKEKLTGNTAAFLKKKPANNVLLFGDGGTGKSTSIRALANQYYDDGLRIIQVYRHQMRFLSKIITAVKRRNYRFIIYMDDLSFEDFETEYKYLKAVIEGGLEQRPENVLIYATSNRRHLIKETWSDRDDMEHTGDLHRSDSIEEKLSLADRFGVQIYYGKPTREEFHHIIEVLAIREKIMIDFDVLHSEANKWEVRHGGVSGRSARQFIDYIKGTEEN